MYNLPPPHGRYGHQGPHDHHGGHGGQGGHGGLVGHGGDQALAGLRISIKGFPGRDFAESRDPRIFWDGISLKFLTRNFDQKVCVLARLHFQLINIVNSIHFGRFVHYEFIGNAK